MVARVGTILFFLEMESDEFLLIAGDIIAATKVQMPLLVTTIMTLYPHTPVSIQDDGGSFLSPPNAKLHIVVKSMQNGFEVLVCDISEDSKIVPGIGLCFMIGSKFSFDFNMRIHKQVETLMKKKGFKNLNIKTKTLRFGFPTIEELAVAFHTKVPFFFWKILSMRQERWDAQRFDSWLPHAIDKHNLCHMNWFERMQESSLIITPEELIPVLNILCGSEERKITRFTKLSIVEEYNDSHPKTMVDNSSISEEHFATAVDMIKWLEDGPSLPQLTTPLPLNYDETRALFYSEEEGRMKWKSTLSGEELQKQLKGREGLITFIRFYQLKRQAE